jgi:plasmid stabilization system protein ParE
MAELIWGEVALSDLENIFDYIARDSQQYARHQVERIHQIAERLLLFPAAISLNFRTFPTEKYSLTIIVLSIAMPQTSRGYLSLPSCMVVGY